MTPEQETSPPFQGGTPEDVLAAIRRLVASPRPRPARMGTLILTAAQRVPPPGNDDWPARPAAPRSVPRAAAPRPDAAEPRARLEASIADLAGALADLIAEAAGGAVRAPSAARREPVDRDDLRDLVAEVVREELNGALGERLTRNVRRLVRAEVERAVALRAFDRAPA